MNILIIHLLGDVLSPVAIGAITDASGNNMTFAFLTVSVLVLIGGLVWLSGSKHLDEDTRVVAEKHN